MAQLHTRPGPETSIPIDRLERPARHRRAGAVLLAGAVGILATTQPVLASPSTPDPFAARIGFVRFAATYQEKVVFVACPAGTPPTTACVHVHGLGWATHLGRSVEVDNTSQIDFSTTPCATLANPLTTLSAANGDIVEYTASGRVCSTGVPGQSTLSGTYTVTGGTGRFADASGGGTFFGVSQTDLSCSCRAATTFTMKGKLSATDKGGTEVADVERFGRIARA